MTINKTQEGNKTIVAVEGWLDVETTAELENYLEDMGAVEALVLDFEKLEYISSAGVRTVIAAYRRQKEANASLELVKVNNDVMDVFSMTGIDKKISISQ